MNAVFPLFRLFPNFIVHVSSGFAQGGNIEGVHTCPIENAERNIVKVYCVVLEIGTTRVLRPCWFLVRGLDVATAAI